MVHREKLMDQGIFQYPTLSSSSKQWTGPVITTSRCVIYFLLFFKIQYIWSSSYGSASYKSQLVAMRMPVQSLASLSGLSIPSCFKLCCSHRPGFNLVLLWLWCRQVPVAPIRLLAWELPHVEGATWKRKNGRGNVTFRKRRCEMCVCVCVCIYIYI